MESDWFVEIFWLDEVDSTQRYLLDGLKNQTLKAPVCIGATLQTSGRGSRGNQWVGEEGNFFISFALKREDLPRDLKLESSSIYFAYILKELLAKMGSNVWLKWPNDLLLNNAKLGGILIEGGQTKSGDTTWMVIGIGINLRNANAIATSLGDQATLKISALDQLSSSQSILPDAEYVWLKLVASLEHHLLEFDQHGFGIYQEQWKKWDAYLGQAVCISGAGKESIYGVAKGIDQTGALVLQQDNKTIAIHAGDISLRVQS